MKREDRKAAANAYKDRKMSPGVYAVRCGATGQCWAGSARDITTIWNRLSFTLRQGDDSRLSLQAAWRDHGADSFTFEVVEEVDAEDLIYGRDRALRERLDHWCETLPAEPI